MNPSLRAIFGGRRPIREGMAAWYRKGRGITAVAGAVSAWADASGMNHNLVQASTSAQPTAQDDGSVLFDGIAHYLESSFALTQPETVYMMFKQVTWTLNDYVMDGFGANTARVGQEVGTPKLQLYAGSFAAANGDLAVDTYGAVAIVFNGASSLIQVNENAATTGDAGAANMGGIVLGALGNGLSGFSNIQVKEVIVYSGAHDAGQRARNIAYLRSL